LDLIMKIDRKGSGGRRALAAILLSAAAAAACDFEVTNPGPVADDILNDPAAHPAVVRGVARAVSDQLNEVALQTAAAMREVHASGNTGTISVQVGQGLFTEQEGGTWSEIQEARWIGDDAVRRLTEVQAAPDLLADAHLWAGFANRTAGDLLCEAVIDGGAPQPHTVLLDRAVEHFTSAMELSTDATIVMAARAGRATAHMSLGNWTEAVADASGVPDDFVFQAKYSSEEPAQRNEMYFYVANAPYRATSVWGTPQEQYYLDTGDPRTPWNQDPNFPVGEVQRPGIGNVPWYFQQKYLSYDDGINLVSGREMRLIEAEALLVEGDFAAAMTIINDEIRATVTSTTTGQPLEPWPAASLDEAWSRLKRERAIELWLEGRRMGDLRRWDDAGTPGALDPLEVASNPDTYLDPDQTLCVPISQDERDTNVNLQGT
jgi:hypothetical protein